ncbi:precorrin-3B synthase [uncultured Methylobacterium sp.]|uniref:precorrin-3B synthase n=1 Tax=uncultured Methylobacterium sp. TaxID=157278 RepID=UPI0035CBBE4E
MSGSRRIPPDAPARRGWCPGLARPMPTGDGLLARIHPPLGILSLAQLRAVADAARRFGNAHVDVTARANLQIRGVTEATRAGLAAALERVGLGDARADGGPQRLTLTSPRAGLSPAFLDLPGLARSIEAQGRAIPNLPPKTLVLIEGGGATGLPGIAADLHVRATASGRAAIGLGGDDGIAWVAECGEREVAGSVAALLRAFAGTGRRRVRDLAPAERAALLQPRAGVDGCARRLPLPGEEGQGEGRAASGDGAGTAAPSAVRTRSSATPAVTETGASQEPQGRSLMPADDTLLELEAPFGRCTADMLVRLAEAGAALGAADIRLSPARGFVLHAQDSRPDRRAELLAGLTAAGFVTAPDDPRRAVAACPGAPACGSGSTPTGADAARLAAAFRPLAARGLTAHVSGCAKGCAHPGRADLTLVGRGGRYGVVLDGMPGDAPAWELTFEAALERVWRANSSTLAEAFDIQAAGLQAFASPSFGGDARAGPALGTPP